MKNIITENTEKIRQHFNKSASTYDENSRLQCDIGKNLIGLLRQYQTQASIIIDLGCGTGLTTTKLAHSFNYDHFYAIDIADNLLALAKLKLAPYAVKLYNYNYQDINFDITFDLIFSNMALHWSTNFAETLLLAYKHLNINGTLAFSIPLAGTFVELSNCTKNHFYSMADIEKLLTEIGFMKIYYCADLMTVKFNSPLMALRSIKAVGANYTFTKQHAALRGKEFLHTFMCDKDGGFSLNYHIGYFIAKRISPCQ